METRWLIIGGGFAGGALAWALARAGHGPGVVLERELAFGFHASGRNAALVKVSESDPVIAILARRTLDAVRSLEATSEHLVRRTGGVTLAGGASAAELELIHRELLRAGLASRLLSSTDARQELPFLHMLDFEVALWCADEGVADVHALLGRYLNVAREGGFVLRTNTCVEELIVEGGRAVGVRTSSGQEFRAECVIDASGAWAGRLPHGTLPVPLTPLRRHLFVSGPVDFVRPDMPFVWMEGAAFYFRPEGNGLLLSPCDETPMGPGVPPTDPAATELLADKLALHAPSLSDLGIRRSWACLRTFAPDRRPVIGPDPKVPGLFHVSALGGFGVTCSAAIGELAAALLTGHEVDWIDTSAVSPRRLLSLAASGG